MEKSGLTNYYGNEVNSMSCISDTVCIGDKISAGNKNRLTDVSLQELCTTQENYEKSSHVPALLENKFLENVSISFFLPAV